MKVVTADFGMTGKVVSAEQNQKLEKTIFSVYPMCIHGGRMMKVKARAVGNSTTLTIPAEFKVNKGEEFEVTQLADGSIVFKPEHKNPFEGDWFNMDLKQTDISEMVEDLASEWS